MWRHVVANALTFLVVALFLLGGVVAWGVREYSEAGPLESPVCLRVPSGGTMRGVSADLAEQGAITSPTVFRIGADYSDKAALLKSGSFLVPERASMRDILRDADGCAITAPTPRQRRHSATAHASSASLIVRSRYVRVRSKPRAARAGG